MLLADRRDCHHGHETITDILDCWTVEFQSLVVDDSWSVQLSAASQLPSNEGGKLSFAWSEVDDDDVYAMI